MQMTSANRFHSKPVSAKLFLVPPPAAPANTGKSTFRISFRMPAISRDQLITGALLLTTFWATHLLLEHVFHI
jgi:hypothetical protein